MRQHGRSRPASRTSDAGDRDRPCEMRCARGLGAVLVGLAVVASCTGSGDTRTEDGQPTIVVMDDFESGALADWRAANAGAGGWFVYRDGRTAPDAAQSDPNVPFNVPDPPQGKFAAVTDMDGPGTRILYRDVKLDGRFTLKLTIFYAGSAPFAIPDTLAFDRPEANEQFRVDLIEPSAPIDSVEDGDVVANVFQTSPGDPVRLEPTEVSVDSSAWAGRTVRLRLAGTDNSGPLRVGVDNIRFEPLDADARVQFPVTEEASSAVDLVLHRMGEVEAVAALSARAGELAATDEFSGAVLVARDGQVLLADAWGLADRVAGTANTPDTKFRIGSMNKMVTAVATLQLVEAGRIVLDDPIGKYLPNYPNAEVASKVTVRHLLTHTGGTGDIFGPEFDRNRLTLREHGDYVELFGSRGPAFEPGSRFEYSNYGFVLLGAVIEAVTGQSYYGYVRTNVFQPAGMTSTDSLPESEPVPDRAVGYMRSGDHWVPNTDTLPWRGTAAGGGYSTVGDLMRFAQALGSGTLISPAMLAEATHPQAEQYGYGFGTGDNPVPFYGHGGGAPGMNGDLRIYPELGYVVIALSNLDPPAASRLMDFFTLRMPDQ
jgi:CubicO group peptidase (beta-lactamase class C family)